MTSANISEPRFSHGRVILSDGVHHLVQQGRLNVLHYLERHLSGDWGDVPPERKRANEYGVNGRELLFSRYALTPTSRLYIITEGDRSVTSLWLVRRVLIQS